MKIRSRRLLCAQARHNASADHSFIENPRCFHNRFATESGYLFLIWTGLFGAFMGGTRRNKFVRPFWIQYLLAFVLVLQTSAASGGVVLITPEEAQLPTPKGVFASRAITRGPRIDLSDPDVADVHSPLLLQLKFRGFGGATINLESLRLTYLKQPNIDLTPRVRPYVQPAGIVMPDAEVPPGEHLIRVEIYDSEGRRTMTTFLLSVSQ